jgi:signal transduction histidine kinase/CheY-like chemotaxis protein
MPNAGAGALLDAGAAADDRPLRVLVVDDDVVDRTAVRRSLGRAGVTVQVQEAGDQREALEAIAGDHFDCVFLDYNIPGTDGLTLLRSVQQAAPGTPIIMLTGQGDEQVAVKLMKAGAVDYIPKGTVTPERLASSVRYALELTRASVLAQQAADELRETALRSRFLAEASALLTQSLDPRETIGELARLVTPFLSDYCVIYGVGPDGGPVPVAAAHHDPGMRDAIETVAQKHRPALDHPRSPVAAAIRTGEKVLVEQVTDEFLQAIAGGDDVLDAFRRMTPGSVLVLPLAARQRIRGAVALGRSVARPGFTPAERELAEDLAQRTAQAFDNAGLYEAAEQARRRTERLQQATASLARALPGEEVASLFVRQVRDALEADTAWVALLDPAADQLNAVAHSGFTDEEIAPFLRFPASAPMPSRDVLEDGEQQWFTSKASVIAAYPSLAEAMANIPQEALGVLPLDAGGQRLGVMTIGFRQQRQFTDDERALATALAGQCSQALERARLYQAEREARERAETANRAKSEFLARMSHDLRTPLNAIGGYAELVEMGLRGPVTEQQREAMGRIQWAKDHLLTLINDILSFAKLEAGQVTINLEPVDVRQVAMELRPLIEPQVTAKQLRYEQPGNDSLMVVADRERLVQVLLNLATNAVKFTDTGTVGVAWEPDTSHALIHIRDTGCGIAAERLEHIFDPFVQAGGSMVEEREGVGLGLAISRELLRLMNGDLSVSSEPGRGSEFTVRVPLA